MRRYAIPGLVFLFPLIYYFRFVFLNSGLLILQNDFGYLYFIHKAYLLDMWAHGHFPLWEPAEACGYGFFGNPFVGALYPPNLLLLAVRLIAGNYNTWFHQIFTVLGVSWFALGLYRWLMRVYQQPAAAAFAAMVVSTCWMVGEFLRFPNAIHVLAWLPWALAALHGAHHERKLRHVYFGAFAVFCQTTAGYPYFAVYSLLFYAGYLAYLFWTTGLTDWRPRVILHGATLLIPLLVTMPYTSAISQQMAATTDRGGGNFAYAVEYVYGPLDLVGSLIFPPVVTVEGNFYSGILAVFLVILYFWRGEDAREKLALLLCAMGFLSLMFGYRSFLFAPIWSFTPVLNQLRVFGRMATMLLPVMAVCVHQGYALLWQELRKLPSERALTVRIATAIFGVLLLVQAYLYVNRAPLNGEYAGLTVVSLPAGSREIDFLMYTLISLGVVLVLLHVDWAKLRHGAVLSFVCLLWVVAQDTGTQGRYLWAAPVHQHLKTVGVPSEGGLVSRVWAASKTESNFYRLIRDYFELDRNPNSGELTWRGLTRGIIPNWYYERYVRFLGKWGSDGARLEQMLGARKLFFHTTLPNSPKEFLADSRAADASASTPIIKYFNGSELVLEVTTQAPGYLAWMDNWERGWSAELDGQRVPVLELLETFKTVRLATPGKHVLRFRYLPPISPLAFVGLALGLGAAGSLPVWQRRRRKLAPPAAEPG